jgi:hypothetical protein
VKARDRESQKRRILRALLELSHALTIGREDKHGACWLDSVQEAKEALEESLRFQP